MKKIVLFVCCLIVALVLGWTAHVHAQGVVLSNTFKEPSLGFTIAYPGDWTYAYQAPHIVIFSARKGVDGQAIVSLRNLNSTKVPGGRYKDSDAVIEALMNQLKRAKDVTVFEPEPFLYGKGQGKLMGKQVAAEYTIKGEKYKQWFVVIPRGPGDVFHVWSFLGPEKSYDAVFPSAQAMLNSLTIQ